MSMQTDVKSAYRTTTGTFQNEAGTQNLERVRLKGVFLNGTGTAIFRDGGASGTTRLTLNNTGTNSMLIPGEGILFTTDVHVTVTGVSSVTAFYG
jgi:hypothetical protein